MDRSASAEQESFTLGWLKVPGSRAETIGSVILPRRPTTLGEARGGLEVLGQDEQTARWLRLWADSQGEERSILLELPGGWFELTHATITPLERAEGEGAAAGYMIRFDRRCAAEAPA